MSAEDSKLLCLNGPPYKDFRLQLGNVIIVHTQEVGAAGGVGRGGGRM